MMTTTGCTIPLTDLPKPEIPVTSTIYDKNQNEISSLFEEYRLEVPIEEVSPYFLKALLASEDHRFFEHRGVNLQAIARATIRNIRARRTVEGGSTITQQTAKNLFLSPDRTMSRKINELFLTLKLERTYTKKEILEMYINLAFFGHGGYGIEVAAQTYFGKSANELTLAESAGLVGLLPGPAFYSPFTNMDAFKERQAVVLNRMVTLEVITPEEAEDAKEEEIVLNHNRERVREAPYFVQEIISYITDKYDNGHEMLYRGGLQIHTSLDLEMQKYAEQALQQGLAEFEPELEGALVAIEPKTGLVRAMVGGRDYSRSQRNRVMDSDRPQPASAFKPFLYAAAIGNGFTSADIIKDEPISFELASGQTWEPKNYGAIDYYNRNFTLKEALMKSNNVVAARLIDKVGPETVVRYANNLGIKSTLSPVLSLSLGTSEVSPYELTVGFSTLANQGVKVEPIMVTKIIDRNGIVLEENSTYREIAIDKRVAYIVTDMLKSVLEPGGTGANLRNIFNRPAAGKTGTSQDYRDAWFVGYTPDLVAGVYVGYDDPKSIGRPGGALAGPIWANFMENSHKNIEVRDFEVPSGIIEKTISMESGKLATDYCPERINATFIQGTEPTEICDLHKRGQSSAPEEDSQRDSERGNQNFFDWFFNWN